MTMQFEELRRRDENSEKFFNLFIGREFNSFDELINEAKEYAYVLDGQTPGLTERLMPKFQLLNSKDCPAEKYGICFECEYFVHATKNEDKRCIVKIICAYDLKSKIEA